MKNRINSFFSLLPLSYLFLTFLTLFAGSVASAQIPSSGLVGYWPFNGNANDESGNGNNGTVNGATLTTDRLGYSNSAYSFNGTTHEIVVPNSPSLNFETANAFTISYWVSVSNIGVDWENESFVMIKQTSGGSQQDGFNSSISYLYSSSCRIQNGPSTPFFTFGSPINTIPLQTWIFVCQVYDGNQGKTYHNNILVGNSTGSALAGNNSADLRFGKPEVVSITGRGLNGKIDDISIYNRALTPAELTQLYTDQTSLVEVPCTPFLGEDQTVCAGTSVTLSASGSSLACPTLPSTLQNGLVGYWPFCGNANDESGNGNNGTVNGATLTADRFGNENNAYSFDGDDFVRVVDSDILDVTQNLSISAWIKSSSLAPNQGVLGKGKLTNSTGYALLHNVSFPYQTGISIQNAPIVASQSWGNSSLIESGNWSHLVGTYNGSQLKFYLNGSLVSSLNTSLLLAQNSTADLYIGCELLNFRFFIGQIDDVMVHNRALSVSEIQQLFTLGQSTYLWSTGATTASINVTPTQTTTYTCTVTDANGNACTDSVTVFVPQIEATDLTICAGESTTLSVSGINSTATPACAALPTNLQTGLVGYWPFCGNANDASGNGNNLINNGAVLTIDQNGMANNAYHFNGISDYFTVLNSQPFDLNNEFSFSIWLKPDDVRHASIIDRLPFSTNAEIGYRLSLRSNGEIWSSFGSGGIGVSAESGSYHYTAGNWMNISVVYTVNNTMRVYVNGVFICQQNISGAFSTNEPFEIGRWAQAGGVSEFYYGSLDDLGAWNRALTPSEIQQLYTLGQTTYLWSNGATTPTINVSPISTTTYTCTVTTNGVSCTDTITVVVGNPVASITPNGIVEICQGQSISLTGNGGVSYLWSTGAPTQSITVNTEAVYTVTVTDENGCTDTESQLVKVNFLPNIGVNNASICEGQSATLIATGGLSYVWSPATGLSATTGSTVNASPSTSTVYTVIGTGPNGCTNTATAAVTVNALPTATITPATATTFCQGGSVVLNANTGTGLSYQWFNNSSAISGATSASYTATTSGSYTVTVTNASACSSTSTATVVTVNALPTATITPASATTFCQGGSVVLNANTGAGLTYQWFNNISAISGATSASYTATTSGSYTVTVTNASTCSSTSTAVDVTTIANADYFADFDGDGFGDATTLISTCAQPQGYVSDNTDCDDNDATVNTAATEVCNHIDDDCNGLIDDGITFNTYYADNDGDSFGDANNSIDECSQPAGYVTNNTDCNDNNVNQNVASAEICNGEDDDCDGTIDNGLVFLDYYVDADGDGFGTGDVISSCTDLGAGYTDNNSDCDDTNGGIYPGAEELCNSIDDNCDGQTDDGTLTVFFIDNDGDTYGNPSVSILACTQPVGYTPDDNDCNDNDANINPGAEDIGGNGIDENCDGEIDNSIFELNASINLFPNPTRSELNIQINNALVGNEMFIFDAVGKLVYKQQLLSTQTTISVSNLADGNYIFRVGELVKRFVVEK